MWHKNNLLSTYTHTHTHNRHKSNVTSSFANVAFDCTFFLFNVDFNSPMGDRHSIAQVKKILAKKQTRCPAAKVLKRERKTLSSFKTLHVLSAYRLSIYLIQTQWMTFELKKESLS